MSRFRVAMVTHRYWPYTGEPERAFGKLARAFRMVGLEPRIITSRGAVDWPTRVESDETEVIRMHTPPRGGWSTLRYLRELGRWMRKNRDAYDIAYVLGLRQESSTVVSALRGCDRSVILRFAGIGTDTDLDWHENSRFGARIQKRCFEAESIVVAAESAGRQLRDLGADADRIVRIPPGIEPPEDPGGNRRLEARMTLARANHDLQAPDLAPVAVCVQRLESMNRFLPMIRLWEQVIQRWPNAKLWIVGDGPARFELYEQLTRSGLHHHIFMPGSFDDLGELYHAADLGLMLQTEIECSETILTMMAYGLPVMAIATEETQAIMQTGLHGCLVPAGDPSTWLGSIARFLASPHIGSTCGAAARQYVKDQFPMDRCARLHVELFERLVNDTSRGKR